MKFYKINLSQISTFTKYIFADRLEVLCRDNEVKQAALLGAIEA